MVVQKVLWEVLRTVVVSFGMGPWEEDLQDIVVVDVDILRGN